MPPSLLRCRLFCRRSSRLIRNVIRIDLATQVPSRAPKKRHVDTAEGVIDGRYEQRISREEQARQRKGGILRDADLIRRSVEVHEASTADQPFGHGRPEVDRERSGIGGGDGRYDAQIGIGQHALQGRTEDDEGPGTAAVAAALMVMSLTCSVSPCSTCTPELSAHLVALRNDVGYVTAA